MPIRSSKKKSLGYIFIILILGALIGSALGEVIALVLPDGVVKDFFLESVEGKVEPVTLDVILFTFTIGFSIKLNVIGIAGIAIASYILRWYS